MLWFFLLRWPFLQNRSMNFPNFLHECRGQRGPQFEQVVFSENFLIIFDYRALSEQKGVILLICPFLHNSSKYLPNFSHECGGQKGPSFEPDLFPEKFLIPHYGGLRRLGGG